MPDEQYNGKSQITNESKYTHVKAITPVLHIHDYDRNKLELIYLCPMYERVQEGLKNNQQMHDAHMFCTRVLTL